jgi:two-component system, sensor histidine kinase and response regulator
MQRLSIRFSLILRGALIVLATLMLFAASAYYLAVVPAMHELAEAQMGQASDQLDARLRRLLEGVETTLETSRQWGADGLLAHDRLRQFNALFVPVLQHHAEISSVLFTHESGREIFLVRRDDGSWQNRLSDPRKWGDTSYLVAWAGDREESRTVNPRLYDARTRPWFQGAMALPADGDIYWTEPYLFFFNGEPGISASTRWTAPDGSRYVIAHDVLLSDISRFTSSLNVGEHGFVALLTDDGRLLGVPHDARFQTSGQIRAAVLKTAVDLPVPALANGVSRWSRQGRGEQKLVSYAVDGHPWFASFRPLSLGGRTLWLGVFAPENDFIPRHAAGWSSIALLALGSLLFAVLVAFEVARRFAAPIERLSEESRRLGRMELQEPVRLDPSWPEFDQLAQAQEEMRIELLQATQWLEETNSRLEDKVEERTRQLDENRDAADRSRRLMMDIADSLPCAVFRYEQPVGGDAGFVFVSRQVQELFGCSHLDLLVEPELCWRGGDAGDVVAAKAILEQAYRDGGSARYKLRQRAADGHLRWIEMRAEMSGLPGGGRCWNGYWLDVTELEEAQAILRETEAWYRAIIESAPVGLLVVGEDGAVSLANHQASELFGCDPARLHGMTIESLMPAEVAAHHARHPHDFFAQLVAVPMGRDQALSARRADGSTFPATIGLALLPARADHQRQVALSIVDATLRMEQEKALVRAKEMAEEAARMKADFLANMSHEIRTPMNTIIGMSHLVLRSELQPRQRDYVNKIQRAGQHLLGVINDILDFSKIEAGKMSVECTEFSLEQMLVDVADLVGERAAVKGLELVFDIDPQVPDCLIGDPLKVGQILINYANNAVKFTERGEVDIEVRIREVREAGLRVRFAVRDTGIGLTEEAQRRLFQSFQQGDSSTTRKYGGTGLGLAICKNLATLMGGEVGVTSMAGEGSTFWCELPLGRGENKTSARLLLPEICGRRVLVVDDHAHARAVLCDLLQAMGLLVDEAGDGTRAIELCCTAQAAGQPFDLVLLDWLMPDPDGVATARILRQRLGAACPRLLMVTAGGREEVTAAAVAVGVGDILGKPVSASALYDTIARVLLPAGAAGQRVAVPAAIGHGALVGTSVLLVEDDELNQEVARGLLEAAGCTVTIAGDGEQAITAAQTGDFDLLLMDMQMPILDGLEATRRLRATGYAQPIVAMTANAMAADRELCLAAGMNDHLAKPIEPDKLWAALTRWIVPRRGATPAALRPSDAETELPVAAGLDIAGGLRRVLGKRALYRSMLEKFVAGQAATCECLAAALADGDLASAERLAHTLKGVAGNIGATTVQELATRLEVPLHRRDAAAAVVAYGALQPVLDELLTALALWFEERRSPAVAQVSEPGPATEVLARLEQLLAADDYEAADLVVGASAQLRTVLSGTAFAAIEAAIGQFDFETALALLRAATRGG